MVYGGLYDFKKNVKVYQSKEVPGFVCLYHTDTKKKEIYRYKNNKLQDGIFRSMFSSGVECYETRIFAKKDENGEENRTHRLVKYISGNIWYDEQIRVIGQDKGWRSLNKYKFQPNTLRWEKLDL